MSKKIKGLLYILLAITWGYLSIHYWTLLLENGYMWNEIDLSNNLRTAYMIVESWLLFCGAMFSAIVLRMMKEGN